MIEAKLKKTDIGEIPEDWEVHKLGDYVDEITEGPFGSNLKREHYTNEKEARIIQLGNIGENGWNDENIKYTTFNHAKEIAKCIVKPGEIVIAKMMPAGRAIICPQNEKMYVLSSDAVRLKPKSNVDIDYLLRAVNSFYYRRQIQDKTQGSTRARINIEKLTESLIMLPSSLSEQQRISIVLSDIDALLSALNKKIEKKKLIKQGTMQQLLTAKKRLAGFTEPWEEEKLGKKSYICRGGSPRPISYFLTDDANGINWIKIGDVTIKSKYINKTAERIKQSGASCSRKVYKGDYILSNSMSFGRPYILNIDGCIHDGWLVIQEYQEYYNIDFLYYILSSEFVYNQYKSMAAGSSVQNLNKEKVENVVLCTPASKAEQIAIATILSDMDAEIEALETKRSKYEQVKQGMMQQLLTGKIRLID